MAAIFLSKTTVTIFSSTFEVCEVLADRKFCLQHRQKPLPGEMDSTIYTSATKGEESGRGVEGRATGDILDRQ